VAISVRASTETSSFAAPGATVTLVVPASVQAGDILLAMWHLEDNVNTNPTFTAPSGEGYTAYSDAENTAPSPDFHHAAFWKIADSGDAGQSHSWSVSNCSWAGGFMVAIVGGPASGDPNAAIPATKTGGPDVNVACPAFIPSAAPWLEGAVADSFDGTGATPPSGMTEAVDNSGFCFAYLRQGGQDPAPARVIVQTVGGAVNNDWIGLHYGFLEAGATPIVGTGSPTWGLPHPPIRVS
jgi:hypothetical protein